MPTTAAGKGRILGMAEWGDDDLIADVERPTPSASLFVNDWFWGGGAPDATIIPWTWLSMPMALRQDKPINSVQITGASNIVATASAASSQTTYGTFAASATLTTALLADAGNFAAFLVAYYSNPMMRCPTWTIDLTGVQFQTDENRWRVLGREIGDRVTLGPSTLPGPQGPITLPVPPGLPPGVVSLVIEGIEHDSSPISRLISWTTSPLIGSTPGVEGPWFRLDTSRMDGTDVMPF